MNGKVTLFIRKGDDESSDRLILAQGGTDAWVAEVKNGSFIIPNWNLKPSADEGYDTLVVATENGEKLFFKKLESGPPKDRKDPQPGDTSRSGRGGDRVNDPLRIALRIDAPLEEKDADGNVTGYTICGYVNAARGKDPYSDGSVEFFINGERQSTTRRLSGGKASYTFDVKAGGPTGNGRVHLTARIEGTGTEDTRWDIPVPIVKKTETEKPVAKSLTAYVDNMDTNTARTIYTIKVWARDQHKQPIAGVPISFTAGKGEQMTGPTSNEPGKRGTVTHTLEVPAGAKFSYTAFARDEGIESNKLELDGPAKKSEPKIKMITASAAAGKKISDDTMEYEITLWVQDEHGNPVADKRLTWKTDGSDTLTDPTSDEGIVVHTVTIVGLDKTVEYQALYRTHGTSSNTLTFKGAAKKTETAKTYRVEADLKTPHPIGGKFIISGITFVNDKPAEAICTVSSMPDNVILEGRLGKIEPGADPATYKFTTSSNGKFKLAIISTSFSSEYLEIEITAPDGTSATVPIVKPT